MKARRFNMLVNGDMLVVKNRVSDFLDEGEIVKVVDVSDSGVISFAFGDDFIHMGFMSHDEYEKHFEKLTNNAKAPTVTEELIEEILENSEFDAYTVFDKCTVVSCRLPNGYVITESSACVSPENYDEETGFNICLDKIANKLWELEAYRLQEELYRESYCNCDHCNGCCEEDYEDEDEFDECLYTDLDCDDCTNYNCPHNTRS